MQIQFLGAARQVTGSQYCVTVGDRRILIDCGQYQEHTLKDRNWEPFAVDPKTIDAVLITHAHVDHCGLLPKLVRDGFNGLIYTTGASAELLDIVLRDAAHIQKEDAEMKQRRHEKEGRRVPHPVLPLFTIEDVEQTLPLVREIDYSAPFKPIDELSAVFHDAGHILGSAMVDLTFRVDGKAGRLVFTGDIGQSDRPIINDPTILTEADYLVMESTYGDRDHAAPAGVDPHDPFNTAGQLADYINQTYERGGNVVIPTFAIERAQELIYQIGSLMRKKRVPEMPVFLDSPMAGKVTNVFRKYRNLFDGEAWKLIDAGESPLRFPQLRIVESPEESREINSLKEPCIIMSTSGMCTAGRIKHHLIHNLSRRESLILFVGYQAAGTLGRLILSGKRLVRILGREWYVKAEIGQVSGFSGHADRTAMIKWLDNFKRAPERVFLTHGEEESALAFAETIRHRYGWDVHVPEYKETVQL